VDEEVEIVIVELALPFAGGVTDEGLKLAVAPEGKPDADSEIVLLKLFREITVTVAVAELPWVTEPDVGLTLKEKSGAVVTDRV
jgi:hypothetical protein